MIRSYITIALRNLLKYKVHSVLNIVGLSVSISAFIFIFLFIKSELSYDKGWNNYENKYRVVQTLRSKEKNDPFAVTGFGVAPSLMKYFNEVKSYTRLYNMGERVLESDNNLIKTDNIALADPNFFSFFNYPIILKNTNAVFYHKNNIAISKDLALELFDSVSVLGNIVKIHKDSFIVSAIFDKSFTKTHIDVDALLSNSLINAKQNKELSVKWMRLSSRTYIELENPDQYGKLEKNIHKWVDKEINPMLAKIKAQYNIDINIQPITEVHFETNYQYDANSNRDKSIIWILGIVAFFILLISAINFTNMSTALSGKRTLEVGIRKVAGAERSQLFYQFMGESFIMVFIAFIIAVAITEVGLPVFNSTTELNISLFSLSSIKWLTIMLLFSLLFFGLLGGAYPALFLSGFKPNDVLTSTKEPSEYQRGIKKLLSIRNVQKILLIIQFVISASMIFGTVMVFQQVSYMKSKDYGYNPSSVIAIKVPIDSVLDTQMDTLLQMLKWHPDIEKVNTSLNFPGLMPGKLMFFVNDTNRQIEKTMNIYIAGPDFTDILGMKLKMGKSFNEIHENKRKNAILINEEAVKFLGYDSPVGKLLLNSLNDTAYIAGVIGNFNYQSLHTAIKPVAIFCLPEIYRHILLRISSKKTSKTMDYIESKWHLTNPKFPFEYFYLDKTIDEFYANDKRFMNILLYFTFLIVIISCMGLFGLVSFITESRKKELSIRKALGAEYKSLLIQISKEFIVLIVFSIAIAWPLSWLLAEYLLKNYAYKQAINAIPFIISFSVVLLVAIFTIVLRINKNIKESPVKYL